MKVPVALLCRVRLMTLGVATGMFYQKRALRSDE